ncbi:radical SAM family heme chaperone HemW [Limibacillus halophilus]|uniref:Heme chaperone HemW n=1 Tax=Limibacillus halophilus TaxID=1579333 RepID=A0A839SQ64_9PROT|nr:radical SAM family heme chaperone HemW [Limibacillus halophilus]MBB3063890.1 oxygen-independent coproporphyrinogen-3 oxidase [Limibacillus halophilus]
MMLSAAPIPSDDSAALTQDPGFGLYVHWPFCLAKCPYCDFNSHVREAVDQNRWRKALLAEMEHYAAQTAGRHLTSIFLGGGTPSLMAPETVSAVVGQAKRLWPTDSDLEVTLEANPTSSEGAKFEAFAAAGVNRLSIGVQSLDDTALAFLGRKHSAAEALTAIDLARRCLPRFSFDLIYARPDQKLSDWERELEQALGEGPEHISLYQLTIEENTVFHGAWRRGELRVPDENTAGRFYERTQEILTENGLPAYEISNHARPGSACRHNLTYWRYGDYIGIGPGAHGRLTLGGTKLATRQHRAPEAWLTAVESAGHATRTRTELSGQERLEEMLMMGLRLTEGITRAAFRRELGAEPESLLSLARLEAASREGLVTLNGERIRATDEGRQRLNALLGYLLT